VRQTKLASSLVNFRAHYTIIWRYFRQSLDTKCKNSRMPEYYSVNRNVFSWVRKVARDGADVYAVPHLRASYRNMSGCQQWSGEPEAERGSRCRKSEASARRFGTLYRTVWEIRILAGTASDVCWRRIYFHCTEAFSVLEMFQDDTLYKLTYLQTYYFDGRQRIGERAKVRRCTTGTCNFFYTLIFHHQCH